MVMTSCVNRESPATPQGLRPPQSSSRAHATKHCALTATELGARSPSYDVNSAPIRPCPAARKVEQVRESQQQLCESGVHQCKQSRLRSPGSSTVHVRRGCSSAEARDFVVREPTKLCCAPTDSRWIHRRGTRVLQSRGFRPSRPSFQLPVADVTFGHASDIITAASEGATAWCLNCNPAAIVSRARASMTRATAPRAHKARRGMA